VGCANVRHTQTNEGAAQTMENGTERLNGADPGATKAIRNFWKMFGEPENEKWSSLSGGSLAQFDRQGKAYRVIFDKRGNWVYTLKQYTEKELPAGVRARVKSVYYDYPIGWVKEVDQLQQVVYLIHIENEQEWKTIRVSEDEMEEAESYSKTGVR
jgi:hypothetical protein